MATDFTYEPRSIVSIVLKSGATLSHGCSYESEKISVMLHEAMKSGDVVSFDAYPTMVDPRTGGMRIETEARCPASVRGSEVNYFMVKKLIRSTGLEIAHAIPNLPDMRH